MTDMEALDIHAMITALREEVDQTHHENLTLKGQIEEIKEQELEVAKDNDYLRKKIAGIQQDNATYSHTQARLETQLYAQEQDVDRLKKEVQLLTRSRKDAEKKLSHELQDFESDRLRWQQREADLYNQVRSLSANSGEPRTPRTPRRRSVTVMTMNTSMSPFTSYPLNDIGENEHHEEEEDLPALLIPKLAAIDSSYAREAKIAQRTIKAQDKLILDLKNEVEKQKGLLQDQNVNAQRQSLRIEYLEQEIGNVKQVNRSLMEDNESYQILLHEKTISGEFMMNPIMQVEEGLDSYLKPSSSTSSNGLNLAAELNMAGVSQPNENDAIINKLNEENKMLTDTNRALQLYMNKILMKIINNKQLEDVLSIDQPKPKPAAPTTKALSMTVTAGPGPAPTRTLSTTLASKTASSVSTGATGTGAAASGDATGTTGNYRQQRRRTISYWGAKAALVAPNEPLPTSTSTTAEAEVAAAAAAAAAAIGGGSPLHEKSTARRHSTVAAKEPEKVNGGWAKALRRMSVIGWSAGSNTKEEEVQQGSSSEDSESQLESSVKRRDLDPLAPSLSRSGSSTTSTKRSNELATLQEE
ncbi:hypothetical protein BDF14DRAFT_1741798 [Spinellus fusiger]|nr:hypothetical protein BDF14DRAFT_1741798 [Spinellus fusiger]